MRKGSLVTLHYTGKFDNGEIFDTSKDKAPIQFRVGSGSVIAGFEEAAIGMGKGEKKTIRLSPEKAFGLRNEELVQEVPKSLFPKINFKKGDILKILGTEGKIMLLKIVDVSADKAKIDLNHPFAGKHVNFEIKIVGVE